MPCSGVDCGVARLASSQFNGLQRIAIPDLGDDLAAEGGLRHRTSAAALDDNSRLARPALGMEREDPAGLLAVRRPG